MPDSLALPALALLAAGLVALALVWPQGEGQRSPAPFGHPLGPVIQPAHAAAKAKAAAIAPPLGRAHAKAAPALRGPEASPARPARAQPPQP